VTTEIGERAAENGTRAIPGVARRGSKMDGSAGWRSTSMTMSKRPTGP